MAKKQTESVEFINPFDAGVSYDEFLKACGGKANVQSYCEGNLSAEQIEWLINDLNFYNPQ